MNDYFARFILRIVRNNQWMTGVSKSMLMRARKQIY